MGKLSLIGKSKSGKSTATSHPHSPVNPPWCRPPGARGWPRTPRRACRASGIGAALEPVAGGLGITRRLNLRPATVAQDVGKAPAVRHLGLPGHALGQRIAGTGRRQLPWPCMRGGRTVIIGGHRNMSLHEPDHQGSALCSADPSGGAWTSRVCWGFVVRTQSRYTSRLDPATPNQTPVEDLIPMTGRRSLAHSNVGTLRKRGWRLAPSRCAVELREDRCGRTIELPELATRKPGPNTCQAGQNVASFGTPDPRSGERRL
jgi:hypothetical protein